MPARAAAVSRGSLAQRVPARDARRPLPRHCGSSVSSGWQALVAALAAAGARPEDVSLLVCTHSHPDHYGLAATVVARTGCRFKMAAGEPASSDSLREPTRPLAARRAAGRREGIPDAILDLLVDGLDAGDGLHERVVADEPLRSGDVLEARAGKWHVVEAPGHCPNQVMLHEPRSGWLISGDLVLRGVDTYLHYGHSADPHGEQLASLERAAALGPRLLLPGHGRPIRRPGAALAAAREGSLRREHSVEAALRPRVRSGYEIAMELCGGPRAPADDQSRAMSEALSILEHLEARGRAVALCGDDGVRRWRRPRRRA